MNQLTEAQYDALVAEQITRCLTARMSLVMKKHSIGVLAYRMVMTPARWLPTAATDGKHLYFNPEWLATLSLEQVRGLIEHETYHNALGHPWRTGDMLHRLSNIAQDYAINGELVAGGTVLPPDGCVDAKYTGKPFEQIYAELFEEAEKQAKNGQPQSGQGTPQQGQGEPQDAQGSPGQGQGSPEQPGNAGDAPEQPGTPANSGKDTQKPAHVGQVDGDWGEVLKPEPETAVKDEAEWKAAVIQAVQASRSRGLGSGLLEVAAAEFKRNKVDWKAVLRRFMQAHARDDYSYSQPSRRHLARGFYMPSLQSDAVPPIIIIKDISGSTSHYQKQFDAEIKCVIEEILPEQTEVLYVDDSVRRADIFERGEVFLETVQGNGGTNMVAGLEYVAKNDIEPCCVIILSDLETPFGEEPEWPTLWVSTTDIIAPYGETVRIE